MFYITYSFKGVINEELKCKILKIVRLVNTCDDFLADKTLFKRYKMQVLYSSPIGIINFLKKDFQSIVVITK